MDEPRLVPISALQHYAFCPRQCALIHTEQVWADNWLTAQGTMLHQRVDHGLPETRRGIRYERGVIVQAPQLGLSGKLDLLEQVLSTGALTPVEYKRGKPKIHQADKVQLCAQALALEEMSGQLIPVGALWYWETRRRLEVTLDEALRTHTRHLIKAVSHLLQQGNTPHATPGKHCLACSLNELCQPSVQHTDRSSDYIRRLYLTEERDEETPE
ncbi:CRISPR-associated protein Cas4 [Dickeya oryzae]|uniref:CRISPR-associated protein Cas4 n=1 Tax=Dickeya oryzae TaxID=1240404 RepID=UPI001AEC95A9|nr:CRISPR-associated protein Cas4 [Dickeya oryzae]MBP2844952.1 CRISPR-associated protein Cas4 [Dickeya oryzae]